MPAFRRSLPILCLVLVLLVSGAPAVANELDDALARQKELAAEIARQQAAMSALLRQQGSLKAQLAATRKALVSTTANLAKVRSLIGALDANLARVGRELAALDAQIREIDAEIGRLDAAEAQKTRELSARMAILRQRIREAYMAGRLPVVVGLLLDSGTLLSGALDASLLTRLGEDDRRLAAEITAARAVITELEATQRVSRASAAALDAGQAVTPAAEWLLGLNRAGQVLTLAPCFPRHWPRLQASVCVGDFSFDSVIDNTAAVGTGIAGVTLDGVAQVQVNGIAALPLTGGGSHRVVLRLGPKAAPPVSFG